MRLNHTSGGVFDISSFAFDESTDNNRKKVDTWCKNGTRGHACAGDNLVCVHMINAAPPVLRMSEVSYDRSPRISTRVPEISRLSTKDSDLERGRSKLFNRDPRKSRIDERGYSRDELSTRGYRMAVGIRAYLSSRSAGFSNAVVPFHIRVNLGAVRLIDPEYHSSFLTLPFLFPPSR